MSRAKTHLIAATGAAGLLVLLLAAGCGNLTKIGTQIGQGAGVITEEEAESINRTSEALQKTFADITPEQEYYIGRAVAATLLQSYPPLDDPAAHRYVNLLGQTLAMASDRPETFGGYRLTPPEGKSLLPILRGEERRRGPIFWEHEGNRAVRDGKWKLVTRHPGRWELYDMETDGTEMNDLAERYGTVARYMGRLWEKWADRCGVEPWERVRAQQPRGQ